MSFNNFPTLYGSLYLYANGTTTNTSSGTFVKIVAGWANGDSSNTTVSATNSNITINQTREVMISFTATITTGTYFYYTSIYINGSQYNPAYNGATCYSSNTTYKNSCLYSATYGDVVEVRIKAQNGSDPANRPTVYNANFNIVGV